MTNYAEFEIQAIQLLRGSHAGTGKTGSGCVMNVISYLNGDPQITDQSECVCYVLRPLFIWFNDFLVDRDREILIPYILRAMGSKTEHRPEIARRLDLIVNFANQQSVLAASQAKWAEKSAAQSAAKSAQSAAEWAAEWAAKWAEKSAAEWAVKSAAKSAAEWAAQSAAQSAQSAAEWAAKWAEKSAAQSAAEWAVKSAKWAVESLGWAMKSAELAAKSEGHYNQTKLYFMAMLDDYLPALEADTIAPIVKKRMVTLNEIAEVI